MTVEPSVGPDKLGDPANWVDQYGDDLFRYALQRVRDNDTAEDLVQETFLVALTARDSFSGKSSPRTWLIAILRRKMVDRFRERLREQPFTDLETDDPITDEMFSQRGYWKKTTVASTPSDWGSNPRKVLEHREFQVVLERCLKHMPQRQAEAFVLREVEEMTTPEICDSLAVTETNLFALLHRARMRLRQCLEINWFGVRTGFLGLKRKPR